MYHHCGLGYTILPNRRKASSFAVLWMLLAYYIIIMVLFTWQDRRETVLRIEYSVAMYKVGMAC